jgi:hypothetical protein
LNWTTDQQTEIDVDGSFIVNDAEQVLRGARS